MSAITLTTNGQYLWWKSERKNDLTTFSILDSSVFDGASLERIVTSYDIDRELPDFTDVYTEATSVTTKAVIPFTASAKGMVAVWRLKDATARTSIKVHRFDSLIKVQL